MTIRTFFRYFFHRKATKKTLFFVVFSTFPIFKLAGGIFDVDFSSDEICCRITGF
jgi:hypothetical protein